MKKAILTPLLCLCFSCLAFGSVADDTPQQDIRKPLRMSGKKIYTEEILHSESEVLSLLSINPEFVSQYKKGKSLQGTGTGLLIGGIVTLSGGMAVMIAGIASTDFEDYSYVYDSKYYIGWAVAAVGELMIDGAVVCKIVGKSYIRKSIANYNQAIKPTGYVPGSFDYQLGLLDNGRVGLKVTF